MKFFFVLLLICFSVGLFGLSNVALGADASLSILPSRGGPYKIGETFNVDIWAETGGNNIDTIRVNLTFPARLMEVENVLLRSVYTVSAGGNTYNNSAGTISWGAGVYNGTENDATFATIVFKAKGNGTAEIDFSSGTKMIFNGQRVPIRTSRGIYALGKAILPLPPEEEEEIVPSEEEVVPPLFDISIELATKKTRRILYLILLSVVCIAVIIIVACIIYKKRKRKKSSE